MKKVYTLITMFSFLLVNNIYANHEFSILHVRLFDNSLLTVEIAGRVYEQPCQEIVIDDLYPGRHYIKVYKFNYAYRGHQYKLFPSLLFAGFINIQPEVELYAVIDRYNRFKITNMQPLFVMDDFDCPYGCAGNCFHNSYNHPNSFQSNIHHHTICMKNQLSVQDFEMLKQSIQNKNFDSIKKQVAIQYVSGNHISAQQVKEIVGLFSFESTRVEFAKAAYQSTCDKNKYFIVYDAFNFNSSINEMNRFIAMR